MPPPLFRKNVEPPPFGLFDVHANVGQTNAEAVSFGRLSGDEYLRLMEAAGIARACTFPPQMDRYAAANAKLAGWAAQTDGRVLPFARLSGTRGPRPVRAFWQVRKTMRAFAERQPPEAVDLGRYAGIKLIPHMSGLPNEAVFEDIAAHDLPILIHAGTHSPPAWIERTVLPKTRGPLILAHLGAFPADADLLRDAVALAARHARVYLDTSGAWMAGFIQYAAARIPEKLLFGSDAPMMHPLVAWHHLASAVRDDALLQRIGRENAERLFGPVAAPAASPSSTS